MGAYIYIYIVEEVMLVNGKCMSGVGSEWGTYAEDKQSINVTQKVEVDVSPILWVITSLCFDFEACNSPCDVIKCHPILFFFWKKKSNKTKFGINLFYLVATTLYMTLILPQSKYRSITSL